MTLNQMVDDLLQTCEKVDADRTLSIEKSQVILWIHAYRLIVMRQDINSNSIIDPSYISSLSRVLQLTKQQTETGIDGRFQYRTPDELPEFPVLTGRFAILSVVVRYVPPGISPPPPQYMNTPGGIQVPLGDEASSFYMQHSRYEPFSIAGHIAEKRLYVDCFFRSAIYRDILPSNITCDIRAILCNPDEEKPDDASPVSYMDRPYPLPDWKWPRVKQMILSKELSWLLPPQATAQAAQELKLEEKENENNPAVMMQEGADLYEAQ